MLLNDLNFKLDNSNFFIVFMNIKRIKFIIMYVSKIDGFVKWIDWLVLRNKFVLIVLLIVINCICLLFNFFCSLFVIIFFFLFYRVNYWLKIMLYVIFFFL